MPCPGECFQNKESGFKIVDGVISWKSHGISDDGAETVDVISYVCPLPEFEGISPHRVELECFSIPSDDIGKDVLIHCLGETCGIIGLTLSGI